MGLNTGQLAGMGSPDGRRPYTSLVRARTGINQAPFAAIQPSQKGGIRGEFTNKNDETPVMFVGL